MNELAKHKGHPHTTMPAVGKIFKRDVKDSKAASDKDPWYETRINKKWDRCGWGPVCKRHGMSARAIDQKGPVRTTIKEVNDDEAGKLREKLEEGAEEWDRRARDEGFQTFHPHELSKLLGALFLGEEKCRGMTVEH